ncbi:16277_t:CDS:2 [Dentiscutata erythropus]|uniref:16277_t:CDS:1 n=1 Tax=Dentiscutata erythropus TaxID=1348616 RepID=A0A9N9GQR7_9GLOM|nr:16277_t:CDS:2 [Dentiscutata erythropus]
MSATSNQLQQLHKYIIEKNINSYDYTRFRNVELRDLQESHAQLKLYHGVDIHPNIIRFNGITRKEGDSSIIPYILIFENVNGGTLRSYLHENSQHFSWNDMIKFSLQIASAVRYLHAKGIFNLGLRSDNIFVHNKNIKLADYGLSNRLKGQIFKYQHHRFYKKSDVYNVGFLMQEIYHNILFTESVAIPIEKYIKIYEDCLQSEPNSRPEIQTTVSNLKALIVNCNQNINCHGLEITHS